MSTETKRIPAGTYMAKALVFKEPDNESPAYDEERNQLSIAVDLFELGEQCRIYLGLNDVVNEGKTMSAWDVSSKQLVAMGWTGQSLDDFSGIGSTEFKVSVKYEMWKNKEQMKVNVVTGSGGKAVTNGNVKALNRLRNPSAPTKPAVNNRAVAAPTPRKF